METDHIKKRYVLGFLFTLYKKSVWLIRKNRPSWQEGLLNGIGGHIEEGEYGMEAMVREFREETGLDNITWDHLGRLFSNGDDPFELYIYRSFSDRIPKTMTDEEVFKIDIHSIYSDVNLKIIPNVRWLIPLVLDKSGVNYFKIEY